MFAKAEEEFEVRAIVQIAPAYQQNRRYGVSRVEDKHPFMRTLGRFLIDLRVVWSGNVAYRTTLIQRVADSENTWTVVEVSEKYAELEEPFGKIQEIPEDEQFVILTILSEKAENLSTFGALLDGGGDLLTPDVAVEEDEMAAEEVGQEIPTEEVHGQDVPAGELEFQPRPREGAEEVIHVGDMELTEHSNMKDLRQAAKFLKIPSSGSKKKVFDRIRSSYELSLKQRALEVARLEFALAHPEPKMREEPKQPSEREKKAA